MPKVSNTGGGASPKRHECIKATNWAMKMLNWEYDHKYESQHKNEKFTSGLPIFVDPLASFRQFKAFLGPSLGSVRLPPIPDDTEKEFRHIVPFYKIIMRL